MSVSVLGTAPPAVPGSAQGLHLIVADIEAAAAADLIAHGVKPAEVYHCSTGRGCRFPGHEDSRAPGPDPEHRTYASFVSFADPDGNGWILQCHGAAARAGRR